ncbi:MAG: type II toxin-antitoxin system RelE/ParE family toxin [Proteobacteria bacterium]|nr:type II toxin-antitoxin system RelE/ParE family toxin [Pseudomonadota bacterium]
MKIYLQVKARADLKAIWHYSYTKWGIEKADLYLHDVEKGFNLISDNPEIGFACDYIRGGYRQLNINKHVIFYKRDSSRISIIRVLHESMEYKTNLQ